MSASKNLGQVAGLFVGTSAPENTSLIWYDSTPNQRCHKVYDDDKKLWVALNPQIVSLTTYSELVTNAKKNGLSIGKFYQISDKSNVLAIAVTTTKVMYSDSLGNILIDDLGTNIQYHVSSDNLLIDDISGVFNTSTNKLVFSFSEVSTPDINNTYVFGKIRSGNVWKLAKFMLSSLLSKAVNNSLSWKDGLYFNFVSAINSILDKDGGIVSKLQFDLTVSILNKNIKSVGKENQEIISNANKAISENTSDDSIFSKKNTRAIDTGTAPGDILKGDTLFTIISKLQRWVNKFKFATGIRLSRSFAEAKTLQYINNNDTVESALGKIQYILKNPTKSGVLPSDWSTSAIDGTTAYMTDGFPKPGDTIFYAFSKIVDYLQQSDDAIIMRSWDSGSLGSKPDNGFSIEERDTLKKCLAKLERNTHNITTSQLNNGIIDYDKISNVGVLSTDVVRFDFNVFDKTIFPSGCGIGGVISKDISGLDLGYIFVDGSTGFPTDPYRINDSNVSWDDNRSQWPQILSFIPVIYFSDVYSYSQLRWTNAGSFVHVKEKIYLQFIIYFTNAAVSVIKSKGGNLNFTMQVDAYGYKSPSKNISRTLNSSNIIILNVSISKAIMEEYYERKQHVVFSVELTSIS